MTTKAETTLTSRFGSATIWTRHTPKCSLGFNPSQRYEQKCSCPKHVYLVPKVGDNQRLSLNTTSMQEAYENAQRELDKLDPRLAAAELRDQKTEAAQKLIVDLANEWHVKNVNAGVAKATLCNRDTIVGYVDETGEVKGHLLRWLVSYNSDHPEQKIQFATQLTAKNLDTWRESWDRSPGHDGTNNDRWNVTKQFLKYVAFKVDEYKLPNFGAMAKEAVTPGNRCGHFSEEQYAAILKAIDQVKIDTLNLDTRPNYHYRLRTFIELMRWTGMAIVDAVLFQPKNIDRHGVYTYGRSKTRRKQGNLEAIIALDNPVTRHVLELVKNLPATPGFDPAQPFRTQSIVLKSDKNWWRKQLETVFALAGIKYVKTDVGTVRKPHSHMFRDTFALYWLDHGVTTKGVSVMLGHATEAQTAKSYTPRNSEFRAKVLAEVQAACEVAARLAAERAKTEERPSATVLQ